MAEPAMRRIQVGLRLPEHALHRGLGGALGGHMRKSVQIAAAIAAAGSLQIVGGIACAQSQTGAQDEPKVEGADLETVTVTGSLIPTEPNAVAVPVIALDA